MKKILIITDNLPDQINGVVTTYTNLEAIALRDGHKFVYISPHEFRYVDCPMYNEVKIAFPWEMGKKIAEVGADHIHIATEGPVGLWARAYLTKHGLRYNTAYHTKFPEGLRTLVGIPEVLTWRYIKWFHKHTGRVLTTTNSMAQSLRQQGIDNVISWTRGVDRSIFRPEHRDHTPRNYINLLYVGRISKEKNLIDFCNIKYPNARKIVVGDGPMRKELECLYHDTTFVGFKRGAALATYYANADVFVMPSRWDTFGIVMIEAMASGTPVAAYPVQGPMDVIEEGITGSMNNNLVAAIDTCLTLDRQKVFSGSMHWSWEQAWSIFKHNLVSLR